MNVGQAMINPAIIGAGLGAGVGVIQKAGHDPNHSVTQSAMTGAEWGLGLGATFVAARVGFASKKVGYLTNPFSTNKIDTTGMGSDTIKALKAFGGSV